MKYGFVVVGTLHLIGTFIYTDKLMQNFLGILSWVSFSTAVILFKLDKINKK